MVVFGKASASRGVCVWAGIGIRLFGAAECTHCVLNEYNSGHIEEGNGRADSETVPLKMSDSH